MPPLRVLPLLLLAAAVVAADPPKKPAPKVPVGTDTTVVTEPLTADGYLDYETALNDRLRGKVKPEANAVVGLLAAVGPKPDGAEVPDDFFSALGVKRPPANGDYLVFAKGYFKPTTDDEVQRVNDTEGELRTKPWKAADHPKWAEWLKANDTPLAAVVAAAKRKEFFFPLVSRPKDGSPGTLMGAGVHLPQQCRQVATTLIIRAMLRCGEGKHDDAWADILAVHRLGRLVARGGTSIETLIGVALGAIAHAAEQQFIAAAKPDAKTALRCQADLLALPPWPATADKLALTERFVALDMLQYLRRGVGVFDDEDTGKPKYTPAQAERVAGLLDWEAMFRLNTRLYDQMVAAMSKPTRAERRKAAGELDADLEKLVAGGKGVADVQKWIDGGADKTVRTAVSEKVVTLFLALMMPSVAKIDDANDRADQLGRHGVLAFALAAHHADHGKYPAALADLAPKYLKAVPSDIFSGQALSYAVTADGYRVYSVGANGQDDGGRSFGDEPRGDDLVLQVPAK